MLDSAISKLATNALAVKLSRRTVLIGSVSAIA
jgi:hypothetical protein